MMVVGFNSTTLDTPHRSDGSLAESMSTLGDMMLKIQRLMADCTIAENVMYRSISEKLPRESPKKPVFRSSSGARKRHAEAPTAPATDAVDDGTIDREALVSDVFGRAARAETGRSGHAKFSDVITRSGDDVGKALDMIRACVAYHGYCASAVESAQALIASSLICRDLSKTKKREIGSLLVEFRDRVQTYMMEIGSQRDVMGDIVRTVIAQSKRAASSAVAPTETPSSTLPDVDDGASDSTTPEPVVEGTGVPAVAQDAVESLVDALQGVMAEWHLVGLPDLSEGASPFGAFEFGLDSEEDEFLNIRLRSPTSTRSPEEDHSSST